MAHVESAIYSTLWYFQGKLKRHVGCCKVSSINSKPQFPGALLGPKLLTPLDLFMIVSQSGCISPPMWGRVVKCAR